MGCQSKKSIIDLFREHEFRLESRKTLTLGTGHQRREHRPQNAAAVTAVTAAWDMSLCRWSPKWRFAAGEQRGEPPRLRSVGRAHVIYRSLRPTTMTSR